MVAASAGNDQFRIAEILDVHSDEFDVPKNHLLPWYETRGSKKADPYYAIYKAAFLSGRNRNKKIRKLWADNVSTDTILVRFEKLTLTSKLPSMAPKKIRESLS